MACLRELPIHSLYLIDILVNIAFLSPISSFDLRSHGRGEATLTNFRIVDYKSWRIFRVVFAPKASKLTRMLATQSAQPPLPKQWPTPKWKLTLLRALRLTQNHPAMRAHKPARQPSAPSKVGSSSLQTYTRKRPRRTCKTCLVNTARSRTCT